MRWLTIAGLVVLVVSVFGPWERLAGFVGEVHRGGFDFGGAIVLLLALGGLAAIAAYAYADLNFSFKTLIWGLAVAVVVIDLLVLRATLEIASDINDADQLSEFGISGSDLVKPGWGLLVAWLGVVLSSVGALVPLVWSHLRMRRQTLSGQPGA